MACWRAAISPLFPLVSEQNVPVSTRQFAYFSDGCIAPGQMAHCDFSYDLPVFRPRRARFYSVIHLIFVTSGVYQQGRRGGAEQGPEPKGMPFGTKSEMNENDEKVAPNPYYFPCFPEGAK